MTKNTEISTKTMDANEACAYVSYAFTEVAGIYPITPSSPMADYTDIWASNGKKNLFGTSVKVIEMQSEAGAAGVVHGSLQAGALTTTYTAAQGLLLKIPNMYKIAGQMLPGVIHVAARSLAAQALSIFGDHQDIYACRQTGFAMLCSDSVQEVMDIGAVAHLAAIKGRVPFLHFFDGFRTSHEIQKVEMMPYSLFDKLLDYEAVQKFRDNALNIVTPKTRGSAQNDDIYFQTREISNRFYDALPDIVAQYLDEISSFTGREYKPFNYYGAKFATRIIIAMGSVNQTLEEVVDFLNAKGENVGIIKVHLYRPFSTKYLFSVMPKSVEKIAVLDRTKEPGSLGEPLYLDIKSAFYDAKISPVIIGGRYGLSSKDVTPAQLIAVFDELNKKSPKNGFTIGINDDVTHTSLEIKQEISLSNKDAIECLFYGLGADGTVGANKNSIKIIGDKTDFYAQAYFAYDSKKSGGYTRSHLRFSKSPIRSTYLVLNPHFVACSVAAYLEIYDVIDNIRENGTFLLNSIWDADEIVAKIPNKVKRILAQKKVKFYIINATKLARDIGLNNRTNTIMQSAFFKLANIINFDKAQLYMKEYAKKTYSKKGESVVEMNYRAIEQGAQQLVRIEVKDEWLNLSDDFKPNLAYKGSEFVEKIAKPMNAARGNNLAISAFLGREDGGFEAATTQYEKRGVGVMVPKWIKENCIQCNQCAFVCPHAVIRPFLLDENEQNLAPNSVQKNLLDAKGKEIKGLKYKIQVSPLDCTGCELCAKNCPSKEKSLVMVPLNDEINAHEQENADFLFRNVTYKSDLMGVLSVKGVGFAKPYFEFHAACPGCGETPYVTLISRLFGANLMIANATGCSSIYGGSAPSTPHLSAWANSLFEDNAEFGFGMSVANGALRTQIQTIMQNSKQKVPNLLSEIYDEWMIYKDNTIKSAEISAKLLPLLEKYSNEFGVSEILKLKNYLTKPSQWIIGGDGWAYDIGYGGLDHVLSTGENVNILVLDTQVYSNTGGQSSKASPAASVAQFSASGKRVQKKDLGIMMMTYQNIFVAQINSNFSQANTLKAIIAAEAYDGPSLIIAYCPCISHGIKGGMLNSFSQGELATKCGYWPTYTYDPALLKEGKNPLKITSKEPNFELYDEFLSHEVRYNSLKKINPNEANALFEKNKLDAKRRYNQLKRFANADYSDEISQI